MNARFDNSSARLFTLIAILTVCTTGCGGTNAAGNTYIDNGGVVKIEFKSGGKAYVSTGPVTTTCSYTESGKSLTLVCEGDTTEFAVDDDGALNGPAGGMLARLTKQK